MRFEAKHKEPNLFCAIIMDIIEVMQEACPFPIMINNLPEIICASHFECVITVTHNTLYNSQLVFLGF